MSKIKKSKLRERLVSVGLNEGMIDDFMSAISKLKDKAKAKELQKQVDTLEKERIDVKKVKATIEKSIDNLIDSQKDEKRKARLRKLAKAAGVYHSLKNN